LNDNLYVMRTVRVRLRVSLQSGHTSSANYSLRKHSINALLLISLYQRSRMRGMQPGVTICNHHLWTWSRLEFCGDDLEETFEAVTWGPLSTRRKCRIADCRYIRGIVWIERNGMLSAVVRVMESRVSITDKDNHIINYYYRLIKENICV
jgi:hypothetical protein